MRASLVREIRIHALRAREHRPSARPSTRVPRARARPPSTRPRARARVPSLAPRLIDLLPQFLQLRPRDLDRLVLGFVFAVSRRRPSRVHRAERVASVQSLRRPSPSTVVARVALVLAQPRVRVARVIVRARARVERRETSRRGARHSGGCYECERARVARASRARRARDARRASRSARVRASGRTGAASRRAAS